MDDQLPQTRERLCYLSRSKDAYILGIGDCYLVLSLATLRTTSDSWNHILVTDPKEFIQTSSTHFPLAPSALPPNRTTMYAIWTVGWVIAAILGGRVTALEAQHPFVPYQLKVADDATIVPLDGKAGKGLLPPHLEDGAILSREYCSSYPTPNNKAEVPSLGSVPDMLDTLSRPQVHECHLREQHQ